MGEYIDVLGRPVGLSLDRLKRLLEQDPKQSLFSRGIPDSILSLNLQSQICLQELHHFATWAENKAHQVNRNHTLENVSSRSPSRRGNASSDLW